MPSEAALIERIKSRAESLSPSQRQLARHVVDNYQAVAFSTVSDLSRLSGVSEATVVRFAAALGFTGYAAFQKEVRRVVRADLKGTDRFSLARPKKPAVEGPLKAVIGKELENIGHLGESFDTTTLLQASARLRSASEILVVGSRSTASLATHLWFALDKLRLPVVKVTGTGSEALDRAARLGPRACVVVIGFPRYLRELVDLLAFARRRGIRTVAITDSPFSPLKGDVNLYALAESSSFVAFHCAPLILVNALVDEVSRADPKRTLDALREFEALAEEVGLFHPA
ncbi:MAG: MurR/RpiR family transcriptional regulator [Rhodospirillaceae bacterium]|nr:MurR/RpiR family transcriptional regulator [Rhodospirillaceae bacterium]